MPAGLWLISERPYYELSQNSRHQLKIHGKNI